jgi:hypothetical protein
LGLAPHRGDIWGNGGIAPSFLTSTSEAYMY